MSTTLRFPAVTANMPEMDPMRLVMYATRILKASHEELIQIVIELSADCPGLTMNDVETPTCEADVEFADDGSVTLLFSASDLVKTDQSTGSAHPTPAVVRMLSGRDDLVLKLANFLGEKQRSYLWREQELPDPLTFDELSSRLVTNGKVTFFPPESLQ